MAAPPDGGVRADAERTPEKAEEREQARMLLGVRGLRPRTFFARVSDTLGSGQAVA
ncbi:MAG: hypothetical protein LBQ88_00385 [Treponema sp.]|nr:hypothetical protein [Treponema sp.]